VKEANVAGAEQDGQSRAGRDEQARAWADVLRRELERVRPGIRVEELLAGIRRLPAKSSPR
jgi:hypothetical protein